MKKPARRKTKHERRADQPVAMTEVEYSGLQEAYDHFNAALFDGKLPDVFHNIAAAGELQRLLLA